MKIGRTSRIISLLLTLLLVTGLFAPLMTYANDETAVLQEEQEVTEPAGGEGTQSTVESRNSDETQDPSGSEESQSSEEIVEPGNSEAPGNSVEPGNSEAPGNSVEPGNSEAPENSVEPGNSEEPDDPEEPDEPIACEHEWSDWEVTRAATYIEAGERIRTCSICGEIETEVIARKIVKSKWVTVDGKKYYMSSKGNPVKGWHKIKTSNKKNAAVKWCYFRPDTRAYVTSISKNTKKKWVTAGGRRFYFTSSKKPAAKGFHIIGKYLYYMDTYAAVVTGKFTVAGETYKADSKGRISGLQYYRHKYKTFVLVDISDQKLYMYKAGKKVLTADVVTGRKGKTPTPTGTYKIRSKAKNIRLTGPTWNVKVAYWMAFIGSAYGFHDASWRSDSEFNPDTYIKNGSHGCVNMRTQDAKKLYGYVSKGTRVIIQN